MSRISIVPIDFPFFIFNIDDLDNHKVMISSYASREVVFVIVLLFLNNISVAMPLYANQKDIFPLQILKFALGRWVDTSSTTENIFRLEDSLLYKKSYGVRREVEGQMFISDSAFSRINCHPFMIRKRMNQYLNEKLAMIKFRQSVETKSKIMRRRKFVEPNGGYHQLLMMAKFGNCKEQSSLLTYKLRAENIDARIVKLVEIDHCLVLVHCKGKPLFSVDTRAGRQDSIENFGEIYKSTSYEEDDDIMKYQNPVDEEPWLQQNVT